MRRIKCNSYYNKPGWLQMTKVESIMCRIHSIIYHGNRNNQIWKGGMAVPKPLRATPFSFSFLALTTLKSSSGGKKCVLKNMFLESKDQLNYLNQSILDGKKKQVPISEVKIWLNEGAVFPFPPRSSAELQRWRRGGRIPGVELSSVALMILRLPRQSSKMSKNAERTQQAYSHKQAHSPPYAVSIRSDKAETPFVFEKEK